MDLKCIAANKCDLCDTVKVSVSIDYDCHHKLCNSCNLKSSEEDTVSVERIDGKLVTSFQQRHACCPICCALPSKNSGSCVYCGSHFVSKLLSEHEKKCSATAITCIDCGFDVPALYLSNHQCNGENIECMTCDQLIPAEDFSKHKEDCDRRTFTCAECDYEIFYKHIYNHSCVRDIVCEYCHSCIPRNKKDVSEHYEWCELSCHTCETCETVYCNLEKLTHRCWVEIDKNGVSLVYVE